jgi:hypothetical protein
VSLSFDATLKDLARDGPEDFLIAFDKRPDGPVSLRNVDLSTVSRAADFVVGIGNPLKEVTHIDFQASADADKHRDVLVYNALLHQKFRVPVHSIVVLLRPQATHYNLTGTVAYEPRPGRGKMNFDYEIVRLWERPAEQLLGGPLGTLPLAPLGQLPEGVSLEDGLTAVIQRMVGRVMSEAAPEKAKLLLTASYILTGLRVHRDVALNLFRGVRAMRESDTYLAILDEGRDEGRLEAMKKLILQQGRELFGEPDNTTITVINALTDLERLERIGVRLVRASGWEQLLQTK